MGSDRDIPVELETFARKFRETREQKGLTQAAVAASAGVTKTYISDIERLTANPTVDIMARLAAAIGAQLCDLVCNTGHHRTKLPRITAELPVRVSR